MRLTRDKKSQILEEIRSRLSDDKMIIMIDYRGMKNEMIEELRNELAKDQMQLKVPKNTLLRIALEEKGIEVPSEILDRQLAIVSSKDEVLPAKDIFNFAKKNEFPAILGGILENKFVDEASVKALAVLPSREELLAKMVGSIAAPTSSFVNVLAANIRGLVNVLGQYQASKS